MRGPRWTEADDAFLRAQYPDALAKDIAQQLGRPLAAIYQRARALGLSKSEAFKASPLSSRLRRGDEVGKATRFQPGQVSHNKGLRRPGWSPGRMKETQFKKGALTGRARQLLKPVGTERISKDGYLERKTHNNIPADATRAEANRLRQRRWRAVHLIVWEAANGPVPRGHAIVFVNRDKTDIRLDNLACITRRALMLRNSLHNLPAPLPQTIQLLGALKRQIRRRTRAEEQDRRSA